MKVKYQLFLLIGFAYLYSCTTKTEQQQQHEKTVKKTVQRTKPSINISYHFERSKTWLQQNKSNAEALRIVFAINRTDSNNLKNMDSILIPNNTDADIAYYLPFPLQIHAADSIDKIIFFSYPTQTFGAYENGELVFTGPTNMGRKKDPTPTGLYFTNWKAEKTTSTFDDEWELKWNFNIQNKEGIGWHEYQLPGYPASHSCLRLKEDDARYLYTWADQWVLNHDTVHFKGTPVIVFGRYDFNAPKPWLQLLNNPKALDIPEKNIEEVLSPFLNEIMDAQQKRKTAGI